VYMTPEWKDAFLYTTKLADKLGLEEAIAGSPGWSESGAPWVRPEQSMKNLCGAKPACREVSHLNGVLPKPPVISGPFQNIPIFDFLAAFTGQKQMAPTEFYADNGAIAFRAPDADFFAKQVRPKLRLAAAIWMSRSSPTENT